MSVSKLKRSIEIDLEALEQEYDDLIEEIGELQAINRSLERENELLKEKLSALGEAINE